MAEHIDAFLLSKTEYKNWANTLMKEYDVWGPCQIDGVTIFKRVSEQDELNLNYITTLLPPKKIFYPPIEALFKYNPDKGYQQTLPEIDKKILVLGIHPCDLYGLLILDLAFKDIKGNFKDPYYLKRRENSTIVAFNCTEVSEYCFCASWGTGPFLKDPEGTDLLLTDLGDKYLVEVGSLQGSYIAQTMKREKLTPDSFKKKEEQFLKATKKFTRNIPADKIGGLVKENSEHPVWKETGEICLSCGSCTNVCPTCFCFRVQNKLEWDFATSITERYWDSCQIYEFAEVAMGGNFRSKRTNRVRQWVSHKLSYSKDQYGFTACVGCGRCIENCVVKIDITEIANRIVNSQ